MLKAYSCVLLMLTLCACNILKEDRKCMDGYLVSFIGQNETRFCRTITHEAAGVIGRFCENKYSNPEFTVTLVITNAEYVPTKCFNELHKKTEKIK